MFVGPLIGGYMYDHLGGSRTSDYIAMVNLALGFILLSFNCGPFVFQENRQFYE